METKEYSVPMFKHLIDEARKTAQIRGFMDEDKGPVMSELDRKSRILCCICLSPTNDETGYRTEVNGKISWYCSKECLGRNAGALFGVQPMGDEDKTLVDGNVDHPPHYNRGGIEAIDVIEAWQLGFCLGNAVKYICRAGHKKDRLEDLKKAQWYLSREIDNLQNSDD